MLSRTVQTLNMQWPEKVVSKTINLTAIDKDIKKKWNLQINYARYITELSLPFFAIISMHYSLITCLVGAFSQTFLTLYGVVDIDIIFSIVESNNAGEFIARFQPHFF